MIWNKMGLWSAEQSSLWNKTDEIIVFIAYIMNDTDSVTDSIYS